MPDRSPLRCFGRNKGDAIPRFPPENRHQRGFVLEASLPVRLDFRTVTKSTPSNRYRDRTSDPESVPQAGADLLDREHFVCAAGVDHRARHAVDDATRRVLDDIIGSGLMQAEKG